MASSNPTAQWLHRFDHHKSAMKALAWCDQFQRSLLASGRGSGEHCIKFWNINTGVCLNSIDTGAQVSSLLWSKNKRVMPQCKTNLSCGSTHPWSPNGCTMASAGDEMLTFWNVFGTPEISKPAKKAENAVLFLSWMTHLR
ncbi:hypothetical protein AAC387_Pa08g1375 [Persea americana]